MPEAGFDNFSNAFWEQCATMDTCWDYGLQWMYFVAYIMMGGVFVIIELVRAYGLDRTLLDPLVDETQDEFKDWFRDADKVVHTRTHSWRDELEEKLALEDTTVDRKVDEKVYDDIEDAGDEQAVGYDKGSTILFNGDDGEVEA
jgi:hypothetical protein